VKQLMQEELMGVDQLPLPIHEKINTYNVKS